MPRRKGKNLLSRDLEFLFEIGSLRFVDRTWKQFLHMQMANNAEHIFRVVFIALIIARHEGVKNEEKIIKMALLHDIGESRAPDTNYLSKAYSSRDEARAIEHMLDGTILKDDMFALYNEYEERKTTESKIVKDADNLDVDFELQELIAKGSSIKKHWKRRAVRKNLFTKTAKVIWDEIKKSDPHAWHINAHTKYRKERKYE